MTAVDTPLSSEKSRPAIRRRLTFQTLTAQPMKKDDARPTGPIAEEKQRPSVESRLPTERENLRMKRMAVWRGVKW